MSRRHYNLPPLTTLATFEAAARHLSFKDAAQELSVTPGAVSHQIKALEHEMGRTLFLRRHRGVTLTAEGQALFETLAASFSRISKRLDSIRDDAAPGKLTLGSTTAVAAFWLSPAIIRFWQSHPDISIDQRTQDTPFLGGASLDFAIRYGRDRDSGLRQTPLYRDELVPVGTPEMAATLQDVSLQDLAARWLIHLHSDGRDWTTWRDWFAALGYEGDIRSGPRVTNYSVALQLASQGAGLALGWRRLIQPMLDSGALAVVGSDSLPAPREFYLVEYADGTATPHADTFKAWFLDQMTAPLHELSSSKGENF